MITMINLLFPLFLSLTSPAPTLASAVAPTPTTVAPAAAKQCYGCCPCPIGLKSW